MTTDETSSLTRRDVDGDDAPTLAAPARTIEQPGINEPPDRIGPYTIRQQIGEGGFALVYIAEQTQPVRRTVALKLIKPGMDSKEVMARFEAERQALALMDHPHIAKVFDAGITPPEAGSRPYFVMEHVPGVPLTEHCDRHRLTVEERLALFRTVCHAVQHAHQKGVIHRDLKPTNILVSVTDDRAVAKIIDFGVAKALHQKLTERTLFTEQGHLIGTPEYMSPEQAEMTAQNIDTRSDIYSLGVLLYELLTGALPFDPQRLRSAAFAEIQRVIREEDPPKPSTRLSSLGKDFTISAKNRKVEPRTLLRELRGDLDWIVMMALEKDRTRRYQTAMGLANDLDRHLHHEPVKAGPPNAVYKLRKLVRRNLVVSVAAAAVTIVLVAGIVVSTLFAMNESRARARAQQEATKAREVITLLRGMLTSVDPRFEGRDVRVADLLDEAGRRLAGRTDVDEEVKALVHTALGAAYVSLGLLDQARQNLEQADAHFTAMNEPPPLDVAEARFHLAWLLRLEDHHERAEPLMREVLETCISELGPQHERIADVRHHLGLILFSRGELDSAIDEFNQSLALWRQLEGPASSGVANNHSELGKMLYLKGDLQSAEAHAQQALQILTEIHGGTRAYVADAKTNLARILRERGDLGRAEELIEETLPVRRELYGSDHDAVAATLVELANIQITLARHDDARAAAEEALRIYRANHGDEHAWTATAWHTLAVATDNGGDSAAAADMFEQAIGTYIAAEGDGSWLAANSRSYYGLCLRRLGRLEAAEEQLLLAYDGLVRAKLAGRARLAAERLADLYAELGRHDDAATWRARAGAEPTTGGQ